MLISHDASSGPSASSAHAVDSAISDVVLQVASDSTDGRSCNTAGVNDGPDSRSDFGAGSGTQVPPVINAV